MAHSTACEHHFPVLRFFQASLLEWLTSLLTLRSLGFQGPSIENRKVPRRGEPGAQVYLSQAP
jgi:hypothetical protein